MFCAAGVGGGWRAHLRKAGPRGGASLPPGSHRAGDAVTSHRLPQQSGRQEIALVPSCPPQQPMRRAGLASDSRRAGAAVTSHRLPQQSGRRDIPSVLSRPPQQPMECAECSSGRHCAKEMVTPHHMPQQDRVGLRCGPPAAAMRMHGQAGPVPDPLPSNQSAADSRAHQACGSRIPQQPDGALSLFGGCHRKACNHRGRHLEGVAWDVVADV